MIIINRTPKLTNRQKLQSQKDSTRIRKFLTKIPLKNMQNSAPKNFYY